MKQKTKEINRKKLAITLIAPVLLILFVSQVVFDLYAYNSIFGNQTIITNLIANAIEGLGKPAPVDPVKGNVYIPEAKLVLPPNNNIVSEIRYSANSTDGLTSGIQVTTSALLHASIAKLWSAQSTSSAWRNNQDAMFQQVPSLQACVRGVQLFNNSQTSLGSSYRLQATKALGSGQTLYIYTETTCQLDLSQLVDYVKQAKSY